MENTIPHRVCDFLKGFPPFNLLSRDVLLGIAGRVVVRYCRPEEAIFRQGDAPGSYFYVVREGAVKLFREEEGETILVDQCDEGGLFGLRPLLAGGPYALTARASEEALLYAIRVDSFREIMETDSGAAFYLASSFAASAGERYRGHKASLLPEKDKLAASQFPLLEVLSLERSKEPVTCPPGLPVREAAGIMAAREVGSIIIVDEHFAPLGIATDKDLRNKAATGLVGLHEPVEAIMSSPVICVPPDVTVADVQIEMVRRRISHLCITEDGTGGSKVLGVLSEHDLMVMQGNNPAILVREVRRCRDAEGLRELRERSEELLKKYLYQEVSISFISTFMTEVNDEIIRRAIQLGEAEMEAEGRLKPQPAYCWLALGSGGRGEQLLRTDQDSALIFENVPEEDKERTRAYFLALAGKVTRILHRAGFEYCPGDMMASNPSWCLSLDEWKRQFSGWIFEPDPRAVMMCTIFFDFRPVFGQESLSELLSRHIFDAVQEQSVFLNFLARDALQNPPPLTFFRNFVVESSGEHKNEFDIKSRAMMPLADAARVLILNAGIAGVNNTFRRFEKLAELEPANGDLYEQAAGAYELLMRYRALQGLKNQGSGRYFSPSELTRMERLNLRNSFQPIKSLQSLLRTRFQLSFLGG